MCGYGLQDDVPYGLHVAVGFAILVGTTLIATFTSNLANVLAFGCAIAGPPVVTEDRLRAPLSGAHKSRRITRRRW